MAGDRGWVGPAVSVGSAVASGAGAAAAAGTVSYIVGTGTAVVGAAGAGLTTLAPAAGFLGITPVGWVIIGVAIIGSFLMRGKKKGPPPEAKGIVLGSPVDANAPWLKVYGEPWFSPPLLTQYAEPARLNSTAASGVDERERVKGRPVFVAHTGAGPVAGTGLLVRYGGQYLTSQTVTTDSPVEQQLLTHKAGSSGAVWAFPSVGGTLIEASVQITVDGVTVYTGAEGAGASPSTTDTEAVAAKFCTAENFTSNATAFAGGNRDSTIHGVEKRVGCFLPKPGLVDQKSVSATIHLGQSSALVAYTVKDTKHSSAAGAKSMALKPDDWGFSQTVDGKQYFYVRKVTISSNGAQALAVASAGSTGITGFTLSYSVKSGSVAVSVTKARDGSWEATFSPAISSAAVVKATYKVSATFEDAKYSFRTGQIDQAPATDEDKGFFGPSTDATRTTVLVGLELVQGTRRRYTSTVEVDDLLVCVESGPRGFYGTSSDGGLSGVGRSVTISFKETSATDAGATKPNDPSTGWIVLKNPSKDANYPDSVFRLRDYFTGPGQWFFSIADLFEFTRTGKVPTNSKNWLPPKSYMVEVTATDAAGVNAAGIVNTDRYFSDIFFATATEIRRVGLVLPRQSTLTVSVGPDAEPNGRLDCKFAGASVVKPSSAAATVGADGLPTPRTVGYSRNPVWCACDLITDELVGGGRVFTWNDIDLPSAYTAAAWCDATITLRDGTTQVRSYCDVVIGENGERKPIGEWLATILAGSGVFCYWRGGWKFVVDEDAVVVTDPVTSAGFIIDEEADCLPGACELTFASAEELPSELVVQFKDSENVDAESQEPLYFDDPQPTPRITERVEFPAVRRRKQARHFGGILLRQMRRCTRRLKVIATIGRGLRMLALDPGDIVYVTSVRLGLSLVKFRVMATGWTSGMRPGLELVEHSSSAYTDDFAGPNSGVRPGLRQPSETPVPSQLKVSHVTGVQLQTVGGAP